MFLCRVALINYGEEYGKLVVITDVVDQNRVCLYSTMTGFTKTWATVRAARPSHVMCSM